MAYAVVPLCRWIVLGASRPRASPIVAHAVGRPAAADATAGCLGTFSRVFPADDGPVGGRLLLCRQPQDRLEGNMAIEAPVVSKDELVEVGIDVLGSQAVIRAEASALE